MWDNSLGKIKSRKSANPKPYDRPKSILSRVKDSVTGLLPQPSWLANWLHPNSPTEELAETAESRVVAGPSESEQLHSVQGRESFIFRRPGLNQNGSFGPALQQIAQTEQQALDAPTTSQEQSATLNFNDDDTHSESTSGCSSLLPHVDHKQESKEKSEEGFERPIHSQRADSLHESLLERSGRGRKTLNLNNYSLRDDLGAISEERASNVNEPGLSSNSILEKADESFGCSLSKRSSPQPSIFTSKRPRFSITSFGPTIGEARKSLLSESIVDSPFYSGRTTYGGASAYRRASLQASVTSSPYGRKRMHARPASVTACPSTSNTSTSSNVVLSSSAQRILQALEAMSTPVRDAKRIPTSSTTKSTLEDEDTSFTGFGLNRRRRPNLGPPAAKLSVGTPVAVVSRPSVIKPERTEPSGIVSSTPISAQPSTGKIRSRVSAPVRESLRDSGRMRTEEESAPELPAVPIPIGLSNLPSFSLLPAPSSSISSVTTSTQPAKIDAKAEVKLFKSSSDRAPFTFSAPIITVSPSAAYSAPTSKPAPSFSFSSPLPVKPISKELITKSSTPVKPVEELKTNGSVLDVLGCNKAENEVSSKTATPSQTTIASQGFGDKFKPPGDSWTCSVCCVVNKNANTKCVACETPKPGQTVTKPSTAPPASSSATSSISGFGDKFKPAEDTWTCSVCCIVNKKDKSLCAACESPRPGQPKETPKAILPPITQGFGDKFKMASNQWECGVCMVRNSADDNQCKSCEEPRPGAKVATKAPAMPMFKFGVTQATEKKPTESITSKETATASGQTEDKKSTPATGFKFGTSLDSGSSAPSGGFKFGSSLAPATTAETPFKFGAASSSSAPSTGFSFGTKADDSTKLVETKANQDAVSTSGNQESSVNVLFKSDKPKEGAETSSSIGFKFGSDTSKNTEPPAYEAPSAKKSTPVAFGTDGTTVDSVSTLKPTSIFGALPAKTDVTKKPETSTASEAAPASGTTPFTFGAQKDAPKPAFSFGKPAENTKEAPAFPFAAPTSTAASKEEPVKPSGLFSFPPVTSAPTTSIAFQPAVTSAGSAAPSTQTITTPVSSAPAAPATTASGSLFAFGAAPAASTPSSTLFSFGAPQPSAAAPAKAGTFSFGAPAATTTSSATNPPSLTFGTAPSSAALQPAATAPFAFGASTVTTTSTSTSSFGSISTPASSSGPSTFSFGTNATPATTSAASTTFAFGATAAPATTTAAPSLFSFGSSTSAPATTTATSSTFNFGSSAAPSTSTTAPFAFGATPTPSFAFGAPTATTTSASSNLFTFGAQATASTAATSTTSTASVPFSFGVAPTPAPATGATPAFGSFGTGAAKTTPFSFNAPASSSTSLGGTPAFGDAASKTTGLSFGAASAPAPAAFGSVPSNGFGGTSAPAPTPFAFGAQSSAGAAQPPAFSATPSFNFSSSAPPAFGAQATSAPPSVFQFGSSVPSANPSFNFNAPPAYTPPDQTAAAAPPGGFSSNLFGANPFDITGGSGPANKQRVVRKAVRRRP